MRSLIEERGTSDRTSAAARFPGEKPRPDAIALFEEDHRIILGWFESYQAASGADRRRPIAAHISRALRAHMAAEEEIFYPAARMHITAVNLVQRAADEHEAAKQLLEELDQTDAGDPRHALLIYQLERDLRKHITDEENVLMPEARTSGMDVYAIGAAVAARQVALEKEEGSSVCSSPDHKSDRAK